MIVQFNKKALLLSATMFFVVMIISGTSDAIQKFKLICKPHTKGINDEINYIVRFYEAAIRQKLQKQFVVLLKHRL